MIEKQFYVYILTNKNLTTFYIGITSDLEGRFHQHKEKLIKGFTAKYSLNRLVYYEETTDVRAAIVREKQLKNCHRDWKLNLVRSKNPLFLDLSEQWD